MLPTLVSDVTLFTNIQGYSGNKNNKIITRIIILQ